MSQTRNKRQNNLRAGVFVSLSLVLGLVVFAILTNAVSRLTTSVNQFKVTFPVSTGIGSLAGGSNVRLGGVLVGKVNAVAPRVNADKPTTYIDVSFEVDNQYTVYTNAAIQSRAGLLGSTGWLSISDVGTGERATSATMLQGSTATMVSQLLGRDAEVNISKSLGALRKISEALSSEGGAMTMLLGEEESRVLNEAVQSAKSGLVAMESILQSTDSVWPEWKSSVTTILNDSMALPAKLDATLQSVQEMVKDVRTNILPNVEQAMQSLNNTSISLETMSKTYEKNSPSWAAKITNIIRNVNQISERAEKAIDEISASPWRLLYRPTDREIAYEQLSAASWQLLTALADLKESANMLEEISLSKDAPSNAASIAASLRENASAFEQARIEILEQMKREFPNR
jgi:ABC-type transporter Mla subunit MlaD